MLEIVDSIQLSQWSVLDAVIVTLDKMMADGEIESQDLALARLALEVAERIDCDGDSCGVSLYARLYDLVMALRHERSTIAEQLAYQLAGSAGGGSQDVR